MFNVTVLKMKDIKKYAIGMLVTIIIVIVASRYFPKATKEEKILPKLIPENSMLECLEEAVPTVASIQEEKQGEEQEEQIKEENLLQGILKTQISTIQGLENIEEKVDQSKQQEQQNTNQDTQDTENIEIAQTGLTTQVITNNPIAESYNTTYGQVKIKNEPDHKKSEHQIDTRHVKTRYSY